jgi:heme oxygenase
LIPSLAERLKTETRSLHTAAERSHFMGALMRGEVDRAAYCALLRNLSAIYGALEPALVRHAGHPLIAPLHAPALFRATALARDLGHLHGPRWAGDLALQDATRQYVARLHELDARRPGLLVAHAYVRYLGDLSGGQMLRRVVARNPALGGEQGVAFYDFGDPLATRALTESFRAGLASLAPDVSEADALVAEARRAFGLHQQLFEELAEEIP